MILAQLARPATAAPADRAVARRLWDEAAVREAALDRDSALALYRAASRADPGYFPAQFDYFELMLEEGAVHGLRREWSVPDPRGGPLTRCLALITRLRRDDDVGAQHLFDRLAVDSEACPMQLGAPFLWEWTGTRLGAAQMLESAPGLLRVYPESWRLRATYSGVLLSANRPADARLTIERALALAPESYGRARLYQTLLTTGLADKPETAAIRAAIERDPRPGVRVWVLPRRDVIQLARSKGSWWWEWHDTNDEGPARLETAEPLAGMPFIDRAVFIADSVARAPLQINSYARRGRAYVKLGRLGEGERDLLRAITLGPAAEEPYYLSDAWHNLAHLYESAGRFGEAARAADQFVRLTRTVPVWDDARWMSLHDAGTIRWKAGWHARAAGDFEAMVRAIGEKPNRANAVYFAGEFYERLGDLPRALVFYREGAGAPSGVDPQNLAGLARVYQQLGLTDSAEIAARAHDADTRLWPATEVPALPDVLARSGRLNEAIVQAESWVDRQARGGHIQATALARLALADLHLRAGNASAALSEARRADSLARGMRLTDESIRAGEIQGRALIVLGRATDGIVVLRANAALARAHPTAGGILSTHVALGDAFARVGDTDSAIAAYAAAARAVEGITGRLEAALDRAAYRSLHLAPFDGIIRELLRVAPGSERLDAIVRWSQRRKGAALALEADRPARTPVQPSSLSTLRATVARNEALVDYLVIDTTLSVLVVTARHATLVRLNVRPDSVQQTVARLRRPLVTTFAGRVDLARAPFDLRLAHELYRVLVQPLMPELAGVTRLRIAPDGPLYAAPFEALVTELPPAASRGPDYEHARFLIDAFEISYVPSAQAISDGPSFPRAARVLAVERAAPGGSEELAAIQRVWPAGRIEAMEGLAATETALRRAVASHAYDVLHVAAHAQANDEDPLASHLRLEADDANDGYYHQAEILTDRGQPGLVVLSACETMSGRLYAGEGLMGLARAFLVSGARHVVATQWPVGAESATLISGFYRRLAGGAHPASALRGASLDLRRAPRTAHPFYWAGFGLITRN